ncbi:hypothetical protein QA600_01480 [Natronococcus sp. A-GB1]|uniref:hypothetical protein n=1 Tax=Natronococcus sp. A-GB1 TaxID=3037648 RepID=UPI00241EA582|nr:hypothetical protein [Natronococcus sp. A-GB1]MDG5758007.1 hypothetical protein [Natronococcus sp. A-GB1]
MTTTSSPLGRVPNRIDPLTAGGMTIVLLSVAASAVAYTVGPEHLRVRWAYGVHYGPEYAPAALVLVAFPLVIVALYAGSRWLRTVLERSNEFEAVRTTYDACVLLTLGALLGVQCALVLANLGPV